MNSLSKETSPYLLQHAHNPVDWFAWTPEALEKAQKENKLILVSIGYSTCHWCHVMERESFENEDVAAIMNEHFVCIKVDREERPDVDAIYMEACQIMTGGGGWPLNCFLTPDARPFYTGTYFPPRPAHNRPSWVQVLYHLSRSWREQPGEVLAQAEKMMGYMHRSDQPPVTVEIPPAAKVPFDALQPFAVTKEARDQVGEVFLNLSDRFDRQEGGFGGAPKFPGAMSVSFLMQFYYFSGHKDALDHAFLSLDKMCMGGIYDHLGGGFSRYATDREWLVPHFEKMLYDNALLVVALADAYKILKNTISSSPLDIQRLQLYKETIEDTLGWVEREMTHPQGGFYAAQDADSEGVEGKFFVWEKVEVMTLLEQGRFNATDFNLFCLFYDITPHGNWEEKNILHRKQTYAVFAKEQQMETDVLEKMLQKGRQLLFAARSQRIYPGLDDKVLSGWNALMISAYAQAFTALGQEQFRTNALRSLEFVMDSFFPEGPGAQAMHTWKDGVARIPAFLEDYAYVIAAMLDVYQITFDEGWLQKALITTEYVIGLFYDPADGLFFFTNAEQTDIIIRKKDLYDNATPSANSTMARNLQRLSIYHDRHDWMEMAEKMVGVMHNSIVKFPNGFGRWAEALINNEFPVREIAVSGDDALQTASILQNHFLPNTVLAAASQSSQLPLLVGKADRGATFIYICRNFACQRPVGTIAEALASLHPQLE
jgi:uncharacterized protein YyaL (SSP411 family)